MHCQLKFTLFYSKKGQETYKHDLLLITFLYPLLLDALAVPTLVDFVFSIWFYFGKIMTNLDNWNEFKKKHSWIAYRRFWYHVFTWVSLKFNASATSLRSATDKYFWHRNFRSKYANCECVNAVRRRRGFRPTLSVWNPDFRSEFKRWFSCKSWLCFGNISVNLLFAAFKCIDATCEW